MARRRYYRSKGQEVVVPSAARTTTGSGTAVTGWARGGAFAKLDITAASGTTPNLVVRIQDSPDGTTWTTRDTFPAQTGTAAVTRSLPEGMDRFQRGDWTITGTTPSFTFSVQFAASTPLLV
jgi:hypothetical protein